VQVEALFVLLRHEAVLLHAEVAKTPRGHEKSFNLECIVFEQHDVVFERVFLHQSLPFHLVVGVLHTAQPM